MARQRRRAREQAAPPDAGAEAAGPPLLPIVQVGEAVLRRPSRELTREEILSPPFQRLIEAMRETMYAAPGVGLAAPQVGLGMRFAVLEDRVEADEDDAGPLERTTLPFMVMVNPRYEPVGDETREHFEGCLSLEGFRALVRRPYSVRAHWLDEKAHEHTRTFKGWPARIVQHETDHLDGKIYIDLMTPRSLITDEAWVTHWDQSSVEEFREAFGIDG